MPNLQVFYDPAAPPVVEGILTFETGASLQQVSDPLVWAYEHHGENFGPAFPGALTNLLEDLLLGRPTPASFLFAKVRDVDVLVAATLFLHRHLLREPRTVGFVAQVDLVHRRGLSMLCHVDADQGRFLRLLKGYFPAELPASRVNERLPVAIQWIKDYLEKETYPSLGAVFPQPTVLNVGRDGFVVAETRGSLPEAWLELYRQGYYQGVLFGGRLDSLLPVLIARKSAYVPLDLERAVILLNDSERLLGGISQWRVEGDWLWGPPEGTLILATEVVRILASVGIPLLSLQ